MPALVTTLDRKFEMEGGPSMPHAKMTIPVHK